jgi:hypothetical protein
MKTVAVLALALAAGVVSGASIPVSQRRRQLGGKLASKLFCVAIVACDNT